MKKYKVLEEFVLNGVVCKAGSLVDLDYVQANLNSLKGKIELYDGSPLPANDSKETPKDEPKEEPKVPEFPVNPEGVEPGSEPNKPDEQETGVMGSPTGVDNNEVSSPETPEKTPESELDNADAPVEPKNDVGEPSAIPEGSVPPSGI